MKNDAHKIYLYMFLGTCCIFAGIYIQHLDIPKLNTLYIKEDKKRNPLSREQNIEKNTDMRNAVSAQSSALGTNKFAQIDSQDRRALLNGFHQEQIRIILGPFYQRLNLGLTQIKEFETAISNNWSAVMSIAIPRNETSSQQLYGKLVLQEINAYVESFFGEEAVQIFNDVIQQRDVFKFLERFQTCISESGIKLDAIKIEAVYALIVSETPKPMPSFAFDLRDTAWEKVLEKSSGFLSIEEQNSIKNASAIYILDKEYSEAAGTKTKRPLLHGI